MTIYGPEHPVVKALLKRQPKTKGRRKLGPMGGLDQSRASFVLWAYSEFPGAFKNRRKAIEFLQAAAAATAAEHSLREKATGRRTKRLFPPSYTLDRLEQSVSQGMNANGHLLARCEKLLKK